jgi:hypothetical protein
MGTRRMYIANACSTRVIPVLKEHSFIPPRCFLHEFLRLVKVQL